MPGGLLSALGVARLKTYLQALGRYAGVQALLIVSLVVLIALAAGFGVTALTIWLASEVGAAAAFAAVAGGFLVVALLLQVAIVLRKRKRERRAPLSSGTEPSDQMAFGSIAALAVIGYLLGRRLERH